MEIKRFTSVREEVAALLQEALTRLVADETEQPMDKRATYFIQTSQKTAGDLPPSSDIAELIAKSTTQAGFREDGPLEHYSKCGADEAWACDIQKAYEASVVTLRLVIRHGVAQHNFVCMISLCSNSPLSGDSLTGGTAA
jgi:hypothetical protein